MLWLIQSNFFSEPGYFRLVEALERLGLPHQIVKPVPFTTKLLREDADTSKSGVDIDTLPEPEIDNTNGVIVSGSYTLAKIAQDRGWVPGSFLANLDYESYSKGYQPEILLNPNAKVCRLADAVLTAPMFVKPAQDSKAFAGKVYRPDEWDDFKGLVCRGEIHELRKNPLHPDTMVVIALPQEVWVEARLFVVNSQIVAQSVYRRGTRVVYEEQVDSDLLIFAHDCIETWEPNPAYVLDVCSTANGKKIVELNCLNAAGLYAANAGSIVMALENWWGYQPKKGSK